MQAPAAGHTVLALSITSHSYNIIMSPPPLIYTSPSQKCVEIAIGILTRGVRMDRGFKLSFSFADFSLDYMQKGGQKTE